MTLAPRKLKRRRAGPLGWTGLGPADAPRTLSAGEQRVAIAALAMSPLAHPSDLGHRRLADGMTMVVVTHEMGFARSTSDAVVFMDHVRWSNRVRRSKYSRPRRRIGCADSYRKFCEVN